MSYALVINEAITEQASKLPSSARRLDDGSWVMDLLTADLGLQQACGWFQIVDTACPPDTATTTSDRSIQIVNGLPTVVWTVRDKTAAEIAADVAAAERQAEVEQVQAMIVPMRDYLDIAAPTAAELEEQVGRLTHVSLLLTRDL